MGRWVLDVPNKKACVYHQRDTDPMRCDWVECFFDHSVWQSFCRQFSKQHAARVGSKGELRVESQWERFDPSR